MVVLVLPAEVRAMFLKSEKARMPPPMLRPSQPGWAKRYCVQSCSMCWGV